MDVAEQISREGVTLVCPMEFPGGRPRTGKPRPAPRSTAGNATAKWEDAVRLAMESGLSRAQAIRTLVSEQPDLHQAWLAEVSR